MSNEEQKNLFEEEFSDDEQSQSEDVIHIDTPLDSAGYNVVKIEFVQDDGSTSSSPPAPPPVQSPLSTHNAISAAELIELSDQDGKLLYYPVEIPLAPGDVLYLRERDSGETGVIVQVIKRETATYAQVESKVLWRLLTKIRATELQRVHHEPTEVIDRFLSATVKVRASIIDGKWSLGSGTIVTRNVDIFLIDPQILLGNILTKNNAVNVNIGTFKGEPIEFSGQGFDKINLVTGMKGAGKSYSTKGIINESRIRGMTAVVFDINGEYGSLPNAQVYIPTKDMKFRLDRVAPRSFVEIIERLAPFGDKTSYPAMASLTKIFGQRNGNNKNIDLKFLIQQAAIVLPGNALYIQNMRASYVQSLETLETYNLFASEQEMKAEDNAIKKNQQIVAHTLTSSFNNLYQQGQAGVIVFEIGSLRPIIQQVIVKLVLDALKEICDRQTAQAKTNPSHIPIYPTVFFEEAHMYMDERDINDLIPLIRHLGMNLFFITNTPGELPDSVFRLLDNLLMTRMVNEADIRRVAQCGLADRETIESFAPEIPEHYAMLVSAKEGITKNFPLIYKVRDFNLAPTGVTRSMWEAMIKNSGTP